jgi:hypothetical protein
LAPAVGFEPTTKRLTAVGLRPRFVLRIAGIGAIESHSESHARRPWQACGRASNHTHRRATRVRVGGSIRMRALAVSCAATFELYRIPDSLMGPAGGCYERGNAAVAVAAGDPRPAGLRERPRLRPTVWRHRPESRHQPRPAKSPHLPRLPRNGRLNKGPRRSPALPNPSERDAGGGGAEGCQIARPGCRRPRWPSGTSLKGPGRAGRLADAGPGPTTRDGSLRRLAKVSHRETANRRRTTDTSVELPEPTIS